MFLAIFSKIEWPSPAASADLFRQVELTAPKPAAAIAEAKALQAPEGFELLGVRDNNSWIFNA